MAGPIIMSPPWGGHFGIARSVCMSVRLSYGRSCLGYRHAGCLQLSHRRPPEMCGLRTRSRTEADPPRFLDRTSIGGGGHMVSPFPGRYLVTIGHANLCDGDATAASVGLLRVSRQGAAVDRDGVGRLQFAFFVLLLSVD